MLTYTYWSSRDEVNMAISVIIFLKRLRRHHKLTWVKWSHMIQLHKSHDSATAVALPCTGALAETILLRSAVQASRRSEVTSSSTGFFTLSSVMIFCKQNLISTGLPPSSHLLNFLYQRIWLKRKVFVEIRKPLGVVLNFGIYLWGRFEWRHTGCHDNGGDSVGGEVLGWNKKTSHGTVVELEW